MKLLIVLFQTTILMSVAISANLHLPIGPQRTTSVAVSDSAPDFTLEDQNGQRVTLSESRGKSPVVLVFYRGYW